MCGCELKIETSPKEPLEELEKKHANTHWLGFCCQYAQPSLPLFLCAIHQLLEDLLLRREKGSDPEYQAFFWQDMVHMFIWAMLMREEHQ